MFLDYIYKTWECLHKYDVYKYLYFLNLCLQDILQWAAENITVFTFMILLEA